MKIMSSFVPCLFFIAEVLKMANAVFGTPFNFNLPTGPIASANAVASADSFAPIGTLPGPMRPIVPQGLASGPPVEQYNPIVPLPAGPMGQVGPLTSINPIPPIGPLNSNSQIGQIPPPVPILPSNINPDINNPMLPVAEIASPLTDMDKVQRKVMGLIIASSIENGMKQMHVNNPEILNTLTGKNIPFDDSANYPQYMPPYTPRFVPLTHRRSLFSPTIHNTIINENENENKNDNANANSNKNDMYASAFQPMPMPVNPNFPLLTHLLSGLLLQTNSDQEHLNHKPIRICFEL